jgi:tRNA nucleotidyltransferase (CCA-adding enzyme)
MPRRQGPASRPPRARSRAGAARGRGSARVPAALARARIHPAVLHVLRVLDGAGHRSWLVGGAVRDLLLHRVREAADLDVATPATPEVVMSLFPGAIPTGVEHGTVTVRARGSKVEVTTFRGEGRYVDGRRPSSVTFHTDLDEDLSRRDFTMNALAWDPIAREFRDPFGGRADIRRRLVRAVGDPAARFGEDGLRPLRAIRFAAQLGYRLEPRTLAAIPAAAEVVRLVSAERIAEEMTKLVTGRHAGPALRMLGDTGLLRVVLGPLGTLPAAAVSHAVDVAAAVGAPQRAGPEAMVVLRLAGLLHAVPPVDAMQALVALRLPNRIAAEVGALLRERGCLGKGPGHPPPETAPQVRRWLSRVGPGRAPLLLALWEADARCLGARSRAALAEVRRLRARARTVLRSRPPLVTTDLALDGRDVMDVVGAPPGRAVGLALQHLLGHVLDDPGRNTRSALEAELREWWERRAGEPPGTDVG